MCGLATSTKNTSKSTKIIAAKMTKINAELKFEKSRKRLASALKNLEEVIKFKISETAIQSRAIGFEDSGYQTKISEQTFTIQSLSKEVNYLQKTLSDLGKELEFTKTQNQIFGEKVKQIRSEASHLANTVELDLTRIEELLK